MTGKRNDFRRKPQCAKMKHVITYSAYHRCDVKPCGTCTITLPVSEFAKDSSVPCGLRRRCKRCEKIYHDFYHEKYKDIAKRQAIIWRERKLATPEGREYFRDKRAKYYAETLYRRYLDTKFDERCKSNARIVARKFRQTQKGAINRAIQDFMRVYGLKGPTEPIRRAITDSGLVNQITNKKHTLMWDWSPKVVFDFAQLKLSSVGLKRIFPRVAAKHIHLFPGRFCRDLSGKLISIMLMLGEEINEDNYEKYRNLYRTNPFFYYNDSRGPEVPAGYTVQHKLARGRLSMETGSGTLQWAGGGDLTERVGA